MNYKQDSVSGTTWTRCRAVVVSNPLPGKGDRNIVTGLTKGPSCAFFEETVLSIGNEIQTANASGCSVDFDPTGTITLLDPATGVATGGSMTHAEMYRALFSLYMATAAERDAA